MSLVFICDESGAKWPATMPEQSPGEVGVMAGLVVPAGQLANVEADLNAICLPYRNPARKLHASELGAQAEPLRAKIYDYLLNHNITLVYEAIHSHGFHEFYRNTPNARDESLHTEIATGAFAKVVAFAAETGQDHSIRVLTDRIDPPIKDAFLKAFGALLSDAPVVETVRRRHRDPLMRDAANIIIETTWPDGLDVESFRIQGFSLDLDINESGLTVAADFVAGGLVYYFQNRRGRRFAGSLGLVGDVADHPLERLFAGLTPPNGYPGLGDTIFRHPVEATRWEVNEVLGTGAPAARDRLAELVRGRAYMIHLSHKGTQKPESDWLQARDELGIPSNVLL